MPGKSKTYSKWWWKMVNLPWYESVKKSPTKPIQATLLLLWLQYNSTYNPRGLHHWKHNTPHFLQGKQLNPLSFKLKVRPQGSGQGPVGRIHVWMEAENPQKTWKKSMHGKDYMVVSENSGTSKSSILIGFSIIKHPFWGSSIFGNTHMYTPQKKTSPWKK